MKAIAATIQPSYSFSSHGKLVQSKWLFHELLRLEQKAHHEWLLAWRKCLLSPLAAKQRLCNKICSSRNVFPCSWNLKLLACSNILCFSAFCFSDREDNLSNHTGKQHINGERCSLQCRLCRHAINFSPSKPSLCYAVWSTCIAAASLPHTGPACLSHQAFIGTPAILFLSTVTLQFMIL